VTIEERLKEERGRLGLNQTDFAALAGRTKKTLIDYEKGATSPDAKFLAAIAAEGADVQYILTGVRSLNPACDPKSAVQQNYLVKSSAEALTPLKLDKYLAGDLLNILHAVALGNGDAVEEAMADYANSELTVAEKDLIDAYRKAADVDKAFMERLAAMATQTDQKN
jgi:transcriptional regulator with XRE-family HTH domain